MLLRKVIKFKVKTFAFPFAALILSVIIYLVARSKDLLLYEWIGFELRIPSIGNLAPDWSHWMLYSLPDGLWVYSFTAIILIVWSDASPRKKSLFSVAVLMVALGHEVGQGLVLFRGTFDLIDILFYLLFWTIAVIQNLKMGVKNG